MFCHFFSLILVLLLVFDFPEPFVDLILFHIKLTSQLDSLFTRRHFTLILAEYLPKDVHLLGLFPVPTTRVVTITAAPPFFFVRLLAFNLTWGWSEGRAQGNFFAKSWALMQYSCAFILLLERSYNTRGLCFNLLFHLCFAFTRAAPASSAVWFRQHWLLELILILRSYLNFIIRASLFIRKGYVFGQRRVFLWQAEAQLFERAHAGFWLLCTLYERGLVTGHPFR